MPVTHKQVERTSMWYTPKTLIDLLQAKRQQAAYLAVMGNPPFSTKAKKGKA